MSNLITVIDDQAAAVGLLAEDTDVYRPSLAHVWIINGRAWAADGFALAGMDLPEKIPAPDLAAPGYSPLEPTVPVGIPAKRLLALLRRTHKTARLIWLVASIEGTMRMVGTKLARTNKNPETEEPRLWPGHVVEETFFDADTTPVDYASVIPDHTDDDPWVMVDPALLARALTVADRARGPVKRHESRAIRLRLIRERQHETSIGPVAKIKLTWKSPDGRQGAAVVMPMVGRHSDDL